jgi:hypothetical protein
MKFRKKPVIPAIVEAEQYKPGMEDGFETRYQDVKKPHCTWEMRLFNIFWYPQNLENF